MTTQTVVHNIPPLYDSESRVLLLGSIPSPKSREVVFFLRASAEPVLAGACRRTG